MEHGDDSADPLALIRRLVRTMIEDFKEEAIGLNEAELVCAALVDRNLADCGDVQAFVRAQLAVLELRILRNQRNLFD